MPIIKPAGRQEKELCRFKMDAGTMDKVRQYCEWAGVSRLDDFFQQAADHILARDRDWISHINRPGSGTNPDRLQAASGAHTD